MNERSFSKIKMEHLADKKKAIFKSTLELVKENGFHGTPISLIAKKAGIAAGTIYIYFNSKDELMTELYTTIRTQMIEEILVKDDESKDYKERFFQIWLNHCLFYINNPEIVYFLEQYTNSPYYKYNQQEENDRFRAALRTFIKSGIENRHLKSMDSFVLGNFVHGTVISTAKFHLRELKKSYEELHQFAQIVWDGIRYQIN